MNLNENLLCQNPTASARILSSWCYSLAGLSKKIKVKSQFQCYVVIGFFIVLVFALYV